MFHSHKTAANQEMHTSVNRWRYDIQNHHCDSDGGNVYTLAFQTAHVHYLLNYTGKACTLYMARVHGQQDKEYGHRRSCMVLE